MDPRPRSKRSGRQSSSKLGHFFTPDNGGFNQKVVVAKKRTTTPRGATPHFACFSGRTNPSPTLLPRNRSSISPHAKNCRPSSLRERYSPRNGQKAFGISTLPGHASAPALGGPGDPPIGQRESVHAARRGTIARGWPDGLPCKKWHPAPYPGRRHRSLIDHRGILPVHFHL